MTIPTREETMKKGSSIIKHLDFIILDIIVLELSFLFANIWYAKWSAGEFRFNTMYRLLSLVLLVCVPLSLVIDSPYKSILKRQRYVELKEICKHTLEMLLMNVFFIYFTHLGGAASRLTVTATWIIYFVLTVITRFAYKRYLRVKLSSSIKSLSSAVVLTSRMYAERIVAAITSNPLNNIVINGVFLTDYEEQSDQDTMKLNINVLGNKEDLIDYVTHNWVDEVYLYFPRQRQLYEEMEKACDTMGITCHRVLIRLHKNDPEVVTPVIHNVGDCVVATYRKREVSPVQWFLKRTLDIIGGLVGCFITLILTIIVGPLIYLADPGPIFFGHKRVGRNGKIFTMYKFRSMYQDAEARKAELMKQNKMQGAMFKIDDDPRIIGSEKKDKNGKPKGIGNFIRNTSIDEFPQFWNVLKGDMSLVGTRPPSLDEWEQYSDHHRKRLSMKPGITGMWQVSGRSDIIDFEEVVRLDSLYIDTWTITMDIKMIMMTITNVLSRKGAE